MLHRRLQLLVFAVAGLLTAAAPQSRAATTGAQEKFQLRFETIDPLELNAEKQKLQRMRQQYQIGNVPNDAVAAQESVVERLIEQTTSFITLRSNGGTLGELLGVAAASTQNGKYSLNVINVGEPSDLEAKLPAFTLQRVHWDTIVDVLSKLLAPQGLELSYSGSDAATPAEAKSVIAVLTRRAGANGVSRSNTPQFSSFQIGTTLKEQAVDDVTDAIRTAWEFTNSGKGEALKFKYHPATGLLLIEGPKEAIDIARNVVSEIRRVPTPGVVSVVDEQKRLDAVAAEVARRRELREGGVIVSPGAPKQIPPSRATTTSNQQQLDAAATEVLNRRTTRETTPPSAPVPSQAK